MLPVAEVTKMEWIPLIVLSIVIGVAGPVYLTFRYVFWKGVVDEVIDINNREHLSKDLEDAIFFFKPYIGGMKKWSSLSSNDIFFYYAMHEDKMNVLIKESDDSMMINMGGCAIFYNPVFLTASLILSVPLFVFCLVRYFFLNKSANWKNAMFIRIVNGLAITCVFIAKLTAFPK
jgi:hypothetical protein